MKPIDSELLYKQLSLEIQEKLKKIRLLITDFDGIWTNNLILHSQNGDEYVIRSKADSQGIDLLSNAGLYNKKEYLSLNHPLDILIMSHETNPIVRSVSEKIKVKCLQEQLRKIDLFYNEIQKRDISPDRVAYLGNDLNDLDCMKRAGLPVAVADSYPAILKVANYVTKTLGGYGAVRELIDLLLESRK